MRPLISFSIINNISMSVKRSIFPLVFFTTAYHANPGAERNFAGLSLYIFKTHISKVLKYISQQ